MSEEQGYTDEELLAIINEIGARGSARTTNKAIADVYAENHNPYMVFHVSKEKDKDEWTITATRKEQNK